MNSDFFGRGSSLAGGFFDEASEFPTLHEKFRAVADGVAMLSADLGFLAEKKEGAETEQLAELQKAIKSGVEVLETIPLDQIASIEDHALVVATWVALMEMGLEQDFDPASAQELNETIDAPFLVQQGMTGRLLTSIRKRFYRVRLMRSLGKIQHIDAGSKFNRTAAQACRVSRRYTTNVVVSALLSRGRFDENSLKTLRKIATDESLHELAERSEESSVYFRNIQRRCSNTLRIADIV